MAIRRTITWRWAISRDLQSARGGNAISGETETRLSPTARVEALALPWRFIWRHLADRPALHEAEYDAAYARAEWRRGSIGVPICAGATVVALVVPLVSALLYLSIAMLHAVTSQEVSMPASGVVAGQGNANLNTVGAPGGTRTHDL